jgi:hypothetical protein
MRIRPDPGLPLYTRELRGVSPISLQEGTGGSGKFRKPAQGITCGDAVILPSYGMYDRDFGLNLRGFKPKTGTGFSNLYEKIFPSASCLALSIIS